jgi:hypothetical protein
VWEIPARSSSGMGTNVLEHCLARQISSEYEFACHQNSPTTHAHQKDNSVIFKKKKQRKLTSWKPKRSLDSYFGQSLESMFPVPVTID